jgi:hypothetical protein
MYSFKDVGSRNGTFVVIHDKAEALELLEPHDPYPMENGVLLEMGKSRMNINFAPL